MLVTNIFKQMSRFMAVLGVAMLALPTASAWSLFGPKNYDECILQNMKGVTDKTASQAIIMSCANKFNDSDNRAKSNCKPRELSSYEKSLLQLSSASINSSPYFTARVYNGNASTTITEMNIEIQSKNFKSAQEYKMYLRYPISPKSSGDISGSVLDVPVAGWTYSATSVKTCE